MCKCDANAEVETITVKGLDHYMKVSKDLGPHEQCSMVMDCLLTSCKPQVTGSGNYNYKVEYEE